jgi:acyl-CoA reductase-like NAD-dependent aldehyde dehydrogenase
MTVTMPSAAGSGYAGREVWGAFIDGAFADTADAPTFPVMEAATGRQLARVVSGDSDLADRAVAAARRAFGPWRDTPPRERGRLLRQVAAKIRAHVDELAELEVRSAAENLTYATMELGGKNAVMVLADADLDAAIDVAIEGMFYNLGEATTRPIATMPARGGT